jgi:hypothetical protein
MESKYKTLIPLIIIFFIIGVAIGYLAHKPETIKEIVNVTVTPVPTPTLISTPIPTPISISTSIPTPTATPALSDFTVRNYNPSTDVPTATIQLVNNRATPNEIHVHVGDTVLIKITDVSLTSPLTLFLNSAYSMNMGTSGAAFITFNNKGTYTFEAIAISPDPNIVSLTYGKGTIIVD